MIRHRTGQRYTFGGPITFVGGVSLTPGTSTLTLAGGQLVVPGGSAAAFSILFGNTGSSGLWASSNGLYLGNDATSYILIDRAGSTPAISVRSDVAFAWSSETTNLTSEDLYLTREAAATLQLGIDSSGPATQTVKGPDARATTDVDTVGGRINWRTGLSTGTGVPALQSLQGGAASVTSGSAAHAVVDRFIPNAFKVLTKNSAIAIVNVTVANNTNTGGIITYCIEVFDGTDVQVETGQAIYSTGAKGAVVAGTITELNSQQNLTGGSTLATTWAITNAQPAVISINANPSLTPSTGYPRITYSIQNLGQQAIAIQ